MKQQLKAGVWLTLLSQEEMDKQIDRLGDLWREAAQESAGHTLRVPGTAFKTNSSGKGTGVVYTVPNGFDAWVVRASVDYATSSAKTGGHACDFRFCYGTNTPTNLLAVTGTIPNVLSTGKAHSPFMRGGSNLIAAIKTGPHTTTIYVTVQVILVAREAQKHDPNALAGTRETRK